MGSVDLPANDEIGQVKEGDMVNCERAMAGHTRFDGHMVQVCLVPKINLE